MTAGTPGFIGERLKEAREARGLTAASLAQLLGITRSAISLYETGNSSPQPDAMRRIADKLNLPISFFLRPVENDVVDTIFYRSMSSTTKMARLSAEHHYNWVKKIIIPYLRQYVSLPKVNVPSLPISGEPRDLTDRQIELLAVDARRYLGLGDGPISNVTLLLENNGVIISKIELSAPTLDGFSAWCSEDSTPYIVLSTEKDSAARWRFNIAHELGHLILHKHLDRKRLNNASDFKLIEDQAYRFAAAFLLPATAFAKDLYTHTLDALRSLKPKWIVSISMMIKRTQDLQIITRDDARRMWINYNRRGWKPEEPLDSVLPIEKPRLLRRAFELIVENNLQLPEQIMATLSLAPSDIESLANLHPGFFHESLPIVSLKGETTVANELRILDEAQDVLEKYMKD